MILYVVYQIEKYRYQQTDKSKKHIRIARYSTQYSILSTPYSVLSRCTMVGVSCNLNEFSRLALCIRKKTAECQDKIKMIDILTHTSETGYPTGGNFSTHRYVKGSHKIISKL